MHRSHQPFGGFDQKSRENFIPVLVESISVFQHIRQDGICYIYFSFLSVFIRTPSQFSGSSASVGTPIYASDTGVVICAEYKGSYGNLVKIDHKNGYVTYYAHCSEILVSNGQAVTQGQLIARVGNTGNSTGPHCHFEIQYQGKPQNPYNFIG